MGALVAPVEPVGHIADLDVDATYRERYQPSRNDLAHARAGLGDAAFTAAWEAGRSSTPDDLAALARTFTGDVPA